MEYRRPGTLQNAEGVHRAWAGIGTFMASSLNLEALSTARPPYAWPQGWPREPVTRAITSCPILLTRPALLI